MPRITGIKRQQKNRRRFSIFIDNSFYCGCSETALAELSIATGDELSVDQVELLAKQLACREIRNRAFGYLARRSRSVKEMKDYLSAKGYDTELIRETIAWLAELGYLDDNEFADSWVKSRLQTAARGRKRLFLELMQKGIPKEIANTAIDGNLRKDEEPETAYRLLRQRRGRFTGEERLEIKRKIYNFLSYRGFSGAAVREAAERFLEEMFANCRD